MVRSTAMPINAPCPVAEPCFTAPAGSSFNIQYGYGRPNVLAAAAAIDANHIPPSADIQSPSWYQWVDPTKQPSLPVTANVAAPRAPAASTRGSCSTGSARSPTTAPAGHVRQRQRQRAGDRVGEHQLRADPVLVLGRRVHRRPRHAAQHRGVRRHRARAVFANGDSGHAYAHGRGPPRLPPPPRRHRAARFPAQPRRLRRVLADAWPTSRATARSTPSSPPPTAPCTRSALTAPRRPASRCTPARRSAWTRATPTTTSATRRGRTTWCPAPGTRSSARSRSVTSTTPARSTSSAARSTARRGHGMGSAALLPGFPVLNGTPSQYGLSVPPPDTPYSFQPENVSFPSPVLADLEGNQQPRHHPGRRRQPRVRVAAQRHGGARAGR